GQGKKRSLHIPLPHPSRDPARRGASRAAERLALPGLLAPTHRYISGGGRVPGGPPHFKNCETHHAPFYAPRVCRPPAGTRHRRAQDSTPARASQFGHNREVLTSGDQQSLLHHKPPGSAASPGFFGGEPHTTPIPLIAHSGGTPKAGSGGHLPLLRRSLSSTA